MNVTKVLPLLALFPLQLLAAEILVISSYHQTNLWDQSYSAGLQQYLKGEHHISHLYLDTKRQPHQDPERLVSQGMAAYQARKPALVVLGDDNAINALARPIAALGTPVVFLGMNENPRPKGRVGQTRVSSRQFTDYRRWQEAVLTSQQNGYQALFLGLYHTLIDEQGRHVDEQQVLAWTSSHNTVPLFGFWEFAVGPGRTIGGLVLDGRTQGEKAAELANAILAGTAPGALSPRAALRGEYLFSKSELARWQLEAPSRWQGRVTYVD
ncbi:hypothetical protein [Aeromonas caviae]|uniref:hypothetical protein n=1 Tax=Aeromonas caviae TaxID=648 RepID=UPI0030152F3D